MADCHHSDGLEAVSKYYPQPRGTRPIASPYDPEARYSTKRAVEWIGYKVHLTDTCDPVTPHLIVNVETTPATTPDDQMIATVHASLEPRGLLPSAHWVDKGYTDSQVLIDSQRTYGVTLIGPVADDPKSCTTRRAGSLMKAPRGGQQRRERA